MIYNTLKSASLFKLTLLLFCSLCLSNSFSEPVPQTLKFERLSTKEGLSQVTIFCILQDHQGFMWFGSMDGLNRYNGYEFEIFRHDPFQPGSLPNNRIRALAQDLNNNIWVGTDDGLSCYDPTKNSFQNYKKTQHDSASLSDNYIEALLCDEKGCIWVGTSGGLSRIITDNNGAIRFKTYKLGNDNLKRNVICLHEGRNRLIWAGTSKGVFYYKEESDSFVQFDSRLLNDIEISAVFKDQDGNFWFGTRNGAVFYDNETETINKRLIKDNAGKTISDNHIKEIHQNKHGEIWIGSSAGLWIVDPVEKKSKYITNDPYDPYSLTINSINGIYEDRTGSIWIGLDGGGLNKYDSHKQAFHSYKRQVDRKITLSNNFVYAIEHEGNSILWLGTNDGLNRYNRYTDTYTVFKSSASKRLSLNNNQVRSLLRDGKYLWIGSYGGLNKYNLETNRFESIIKSKPGYDPFSKYILSDIKLDQHGYLWLATNFSGVFRFHKEHHTTEHFTSSPDSEFPLSTNSIRTIFFDGPDLVWIGTYGGGLNQLHMKTGKVDVYRTRTNDSTSISSNFVYSLHKDHNDKLWVGTYGGGLNRFDPKSGRFKHYKDSNGLPNNVIYGIIEDDHHNLWLSTNFGLSKFNYPLMVNGGANKPSSFKNFDMMDGLQNSEFNFGAYHKNNQGELIFGGITGFTIFYPDNIFENPHKPTVVLTNFYLFNKQVPITTDGLLQQPISETKKLELNYHQNAISFEFSALHFSNPEKNHYAYILEGSDEQWTYTNANRRFAHYTHLAGGKYKFRVKAANRDGLWNNEGVSVDIHISPPYWLTNWFRISVVLLLIASVFFFYKIRVYRYKQRNKQLADINQALSKVITDREKAEESLRSSEEKYRSLTNHLNVGIYRNDPSGNGKFIEVNPALVEIFGYDNKEEMLQLKMNDLYSDPQDRDNFIKKINEQGYVKNEEVVLKKKDDTTIYCSISAVAVPDSENNIQYYDGLIENISQRKEVEHALRESEEKYRSLVERAKDGIVIVQDGKVRFANSSIAKLSGIKIEEIIGSDFLKFVNPDEQVKLKERYESRMRNEEFESTYETILLDSFGNKKNAEINAGLIQFEGNPADLIFVRDITDRKQLESQVRQTQKLEAIGQLAGGVAHDFNNILTVINGHAELALFRVEEDSPIRKDLEEIKRSGDRASDLVRQLLAFSRKQMIQPKVLNVNDLIKSTKKMLVRLIGEDIEMRTILNPNLPNIEADPSQLEQVLMNLVINAQDAINEHSESGIEKSISIETKTLYLDQDYVLAHPGSSIGAHVMITISDTGIGMNEQTKENIFDPFFTTKELGRGTGLGLTTVFGIIKQNSGSIYVYSEPGSGTRFEILWPITQEEQSFQERKASSGDMKKGSETLLLVEDDPRVREFARSALVAFGYTVVEATTGLEAFAILEKQSDKFSLVISDVVMPELGGKELAAKIQEILPNLQVLLTSGYSDAHTIQQDVKETNLHFIQKPYSVQDLNKKIRDILDSYPPQK